MGITRHGRRTLGGNSKWLVHLDDITDGGGRRVEDFLVLSPASPRPDLLTGAAVVPVIGGRIGLLRNDRHPVGGACWEIVKGFIDEGESPAAAALRELREETGHECAEADLLPLGGFLPEAAVMAVRGALFLARDCRPAGSRDESELGLGRLSLFTPVEIARLLAASEIEDAGTTIGLYRALAFLEPGWADIRADLPPSS
jgi:ADP-ribose pyrophosphatase